MQIQETIDKALLAVSEAQTGMELELANKMFRASIKLAKANGFNVGFKMYDGLVTAELIPFYSKAAFADGWILGEWDALCLAEMHVRWD